MTRPYEILVLSEGTAAWWEWRRSGIGSSDAATVLGVKPAKSAERLLLEKQQLGEPSGRNFVRAQGAALERAARARFCATTGLAVQPTCVQSAVRPWQRASVDGLSADGRHAVEIKCGLAAHQRASARRRPPPHHYAQLQHILATTGLPAISYWCYVPSQPAVHLQVDRDEAYIERLLIAEEIFWRRFAPVRCAGRG